MKRATKILVYLLVICQLLAVFAGCKDKKKEETVDEIRRKFGSSAISTGALYDTDIGVGVKKK